MDKETVGILGVVIGVIASNIQQIIAWKLGRKDRQIEWSRRNIITPIIKFIDEELFFVDKLFWSYKDDKTLCINKGIPYGSDVYERLNETNPELFKSFDRHRMKFSSVYARIQIIQNETLINDFKNFTGAFYSFREAVFRNNEELAQEKREKIANSAQSLLERINSYIIK